MCFKFYNINKLEEICNRVCKQVMRLGLTLTLTLGNRQSRYCDARVCNLLEMNEF